MTESIKIENPQQQFVPIERAETISWIGYTQRPINQKTQVRNKFLNVVEYTSHWDVPSNSFSQPVSLTFNNLSSTLAWGTTSSPAKVIIPESWTYLINMSYFVSTVSPVWATWEIWLYIEWIQWDVVLNGWRRTSLKLNVIKNYNKWDKLSVYIENSLTSTLEWYLSLYITKLS